MNQEEVGGLRAIIRKCLVEDVEYGTKKDGTPLARPKKSQGIFDEPNDFGNAAIVDLQDVMERVDLALYLYTNNEVEEETPAWKPPE